jgi:hypothetical protein
VATLRHRLVTIGAKIVRHGRPVTFQTAEAIVPRDMYQKILAAIAALRPLPPTRYRGPSPCRVNLDIGRERMSECGVMNRKTCRCGWA